MTIPDHLTEELIRLRWMRAASLLEGSTLVLLVFIAVPAKHLAGLPAATAVIGPIHGAAFLFYVWMLIRTVSGGGWSRSDTIRMALAAVVPFGAFVNERFLARRQAALSPGF